MQAPMPNIIANVRRLRSRTLFELEDQSVSGPLLSSLLSMSRAAARCLCMNDSIVEHLARAFKASLVRPVL